ncbi:hypothetical protein [Beutenbergia cavernae]|uniref:hypothetical protein n=1 Tax=Beutenbergia cavernae TaxID=84757 RepID=UPI00117CF5A8|nr:hypothetical protein [Beutenbergia cavernae]
MAFVLTVVGLTVLTGLAGLGMVVQADRTDPLWLSVSGAGVALAFSGPVVLGSLAAWWQLRGSSDSGRYYRLWRNVATAGTVLGAALVVVAGLAMGVPIWLLLVIAVVALGLLIVAVPVGDRVRRSADAKGRVTDAFAPDTSDDTRRVIRRTALTFAITLVVVAAAWIPLTVMTGEEPNDLRLAMALSGFPFIAASLACSLSALRLNRRVREVTGQDFGRLRAIARVVLKGKDDELDELGQIAAARYAALAPATLGTQLGSVALLYVGLALNITSQALGGVIPSTIPLVMLAVLAIALAVVIPLQLRNIRRARNYAAEHRDLLSNR